MNIHKPLGAGLLALGSAGIWSAMQITVRTFNNDPGPKLFPILACTILVICGIGLLFQRNPIHQAEISSVAWRRGALMAGLLVAYAIGLWLVGFHVATLVGTLVMYFIIAGPDQRSIARGAIYALIVTGSVHLVFQVALGAFLPHGILF